MIYREKFFEENEGKVWSEECIRKELFKDVANKLKEDVKYYFSESDSLDTLDCDYQLLRLAKDGDIEDVIDELTNVRDFNFINIDDLLNTMEYTDKLYELRKAKIYFEKYYKIAKSVANTFEYQGIDDNYVKNMKEILDNLTNIDKILSRIEEE